MRSEDQSKEHRAEVIRALAGTADPLFAAAGFRRNPRSLLYARSAPGAKQTVEFFFATNPRYFPGVLIHFRPALGIQVPVIARVALEMVKAPRLLAGTPEYLVSMPLELLASAPHQPRWCARKHLEIPGALLAIHDLFRERALQFLADYSSPATLTAAYESGDTRALRQQHWYVFVAASYIVQDRRTEARAVLERHLGSQGLRATYAAAHAYAA